jgi:hypothetical protein
MQNIKVTAPIPMDGLKKYFVDNTVQYEIDYKNSTLKGSKLLIYLSNLNIPCDIDVEFDDEFLELLKDYFNSKILVQIRTLEIAALEMLFTNRFGLPQTEGKMLSNAQLTKFVEENKEIINQWSKVLDSLTIYNMQTIDVPEFREFVESHPSDPTDDLTGINFVQLLKYEEFYLFYNKINTEWLTNYTSYFNEYMFKGKNLYNFWANINNPMHVLTSVIASGQLTGKDFAAAHQAELEAVQA